MINELWNVFAQSGDPYCYLAYKEQERRLKAAEEEETGREKRAEEFRLP